MGDEVKANGGSKLAEDVVECLRAIEANDLAQKASLQIFEKLVMDEKSKLATLKMEVDIYKATPSPSTFVATFGAPPGVEAPADGMASMNAFMPYIKLVQGELKIAVTQLKAVDEAQEQDIMTLAAGSSDNIGQLTASAAHVAR